MPGKHDPPGNPLSVYEFGSRLITTNDLDPVYVIVYNASMPTEQLKRWLVAYWCFYHAGTAGWAAGSCTGEEGFWLNMKTAAGSKEYPRSSERRHYRGVQAAASVEYLCSKGVGGLFAYLGKEGRVCSAEHVLETVKTWKGFGPWIAFKAADMLERLGLYKVRFGLATTLYSSPRDGAKALWKRERKTDPPAHAGEWAMNKLLTSRELAGLKAPPSYDRPLGYQEAETVLCKWHSYTKGSYHLGEDVEAVHKSLTGKFQEVPLCKRLLQGGKDGGLWE